MNNIKILHLPKYLDQRGNLSFLEEKNQIPFAISRVFWIYDVPGGEVRGGHAYKNMKEVIIALSGSFDVILKDGNKIEKFTLNRSYYGLYVPNMVWRQMENFSTNAVALVVSDQPFDENEYIRDFNEFVKYIKE